MAADSQSSSTDPTKVDTAASEGCTRSATFSLLLSVVLFLLIPYWSERQNYISLSRYIALRLTLALQVDTLNDDPIWQNYAAAHATADSTPIAQLLKAQVEPSGRAATKANTMPNLSEGVTGKDSGQSPGVSKRNPEPLGSSRGAGSHKLRSKASAAQDSTQNPSTSLAPPLPPTNVQVHYEIVLNYVPQIVDSLNKLNDPDLLSRSRQVSNFFDISIARWAQKRGSLIYGSVISGICTPTKEIEIPVKGEKANSFVPELDKEVMLTCLTIPSVRVLAQFELPTLTNPTELGGRIGRELELSPNTLPRDPYLANIVAQLLLFFALIHFGAYAREAVSSPAFPAPATLFGAFAKSRWTLLVFLLALWAPLIASLGTAITSRKWLLFALSVFIFFAVYSAYRVLQRKSYFQSLYPRVLRKGELTSGTARSSDS